MFDRFIDVIESAVTLTEGGLAGHMMHLSDDVDMTFGTLKDIIRKLASAEITNVTEKLDGQNLFITWDDSRGKLLAARNKSNIKSGGLDADALADKFAGRGTVHDAFVNAFDALSNAISSIPDDDRRYIFGDGTIWYSIEIIYTDNPNLIHYDDNAIVFHKASSAEFDMTKGVPTGRDVSEQFDRLMKYVDDMNDVVTSMSWRISGPVFQQLKDITDGTIVDETISRIDNLMSEFELSDSDTIFDYITEYVIDTYFGDYDIDPILYDDIVKRLMKVRGSPTVNQLCRELNHDEACKTLRDINKRSHEVIRDALIGLNDILDDFAIEVLRGMTSVFVANGDAEVERLRNETLKAIDAIKRNGSKKALDMLARQAYRLRSTDAITSSLEGIVFDYAGKTYKLTGVFAPMNQIVSMFRYNRINEHKGRRDNNVKDDAKSIGRMIVSTLNMLHERDTSKLNDRGDTIREPMKLPQGGVWMKWPDEYSSIPYSVKASGVGPGEERLAAMFGGEVQGGSVSYDIVINGAKYEVKQIDSGNKLLVGDAESGRALIGFKREMSEIVGQLQKLVGLTSGHPLFRTVATDDEQRKIDIIENWVDLEAQNILRGEIPVGRIKGGVRGADDSIKGYGLYDIVKLVNSMINNKNELRKVTIGDKTYNVTIPEYIKINRMLGVRIVDIDVEPFDIIRAELDHPAFDNPNIVLDIWNNSVKATDVFDHVDGLFVVTPEKYMLIDHSQLNKRLKFSYITRSRVKFEVV